MYTLPAVHLINIHVLVCIYVPLLYILCIRQDPNLCLAFHCDQDVFTALASIWLDKPVESVLGSERATVKQLCYAGIYGAGARLIAEALGVSVSEARQDLQDFFQTYSGIAVFIESAKEACRKVAMDELYEGLSLYMRLILTFGHAAPDCVYACPSSQTL
jgi:DNA polymerase family A